MYYVQKSLNFILKALKYLFKQINKGRREKYALTRYKFKVFEPLKPSFQRYADVFAALGFPIDLSDDYLLPPTPLSDPVKNC